MTEIKIEKVEEEIKRFQERVKELREAKARMRSSEYNGCSVWNPKQSGAVRRASLDLTRALADLRRCS